MLVDSTSIPLRNLQSSPPASCHGEGVLNMAANTKVLPAMDVKINGTLSRQFMMTIVLG